MTSEPQKHLMGVEGLSYMAPFKISNGDLSLLTLQIVSMTFSAINTWPHELHIPGYSYCGPGTRLIWHLARRDPGRNQLDVACKEHDLVYFNLYHREKRQEADLKLADAAKIRQNARDSLLDEKIAAWGVEKAMEAKSKLSQSMKKRSNEPKTSFREELKKKTKTERVKKPNALKGVLSVYIKSARKSEN